MALIKHDTNYYPWMTSNTAPEPFKAFSSSSTWAAFKAFNESLVDDISFTTCTDEANQWVEIQLDASIKLWAFRILCRTTISSNNAGWVPYNFSVYGSNDGIDYELIQTYQSMPETDFCKYDAESGYDWTAAEFIEISCDNTYSMYRFSFGYCNAINSGSGVYTQSSAIKATRIELYQVEGEESHGAPTDADFNADSRQFDYKTEIFFDGPLGTPVIVSASDYLIDCDWLEEMFSDSGSIPGSIAANDGSLTLNNADGRFSPTNPDGPYAGKIKRGILVKPYIRLLHTENTDWQQLGEYYVTGWSAAISNTTAIVMLNDKWYDALNSTAPDYAVQRNVSHKDMCDAVYAAMGLSVDVSASFTEMLTYAFIEGTPKAFIQSIAEGMLAYITSDHDGNLIMRPCIADKPIRATLTDDNQIISVATSRSVDKDYDGVDLTYFTLQESEQSQLLNLSATEIATGDTAIDKTAFSSGPVWNISYIAIQDETPDVLLDYYDATPWLISMLISNTGSAITSDVAVYGTVINFVEVKLVDQLSETSTFLKVSNKYIQNEAYALKYKAVLDRFVGCQAAFLSVSIRGNTLLNIGDRVVVSSTQYNLVFDGVISRLKYSFNGGLSCDMDLIAYDVLKAVV